MVRWSHLSRIIAWLVPTSLLKQVVRGVALGGNAFLASPDPLVFKDFEVGRSYTATITLINRGPAKNSLRLEEVPAEVREGSAWVWGGLGLGLDLG